MDVVPEIRAREALLRSPVGQQIAQIHALARRGTPGDQPVPPERYEAVMRLYGLDEQVLEYLPELYRVDSAWLEGAAEVRKRMEREREQQE